MPEEETIMRRILEVPYIDQSEKYPTGCESVSTVMLLQYLGYSLTVDDFIRDYLEKREFEVRQDRLYGSDPNQYFCGSPYDPDAFGCYAPVILRALDRIFAQDPKIRYRAVDETGTPIAQLIQTYIDEKQMPVIFWACINMREPVIGPSWQLLESGRLFTWISNEHCMLLVGYDEERYYFNDPYDNHGLVGYPRELVEERHRAQYAMAVGVCHT